MYRCVYIYMYTSCCHTRLLLASPDNGCRVGKLKWFIAEVEYNNTAQKQSHAATQESSLSVLCWMV